MLALFLDGSPFNLLSQSLSIERRAHRSARLASQFVLGILCLLCSGITGTAMPGWVSHVYVASTFIHHAISQPSEGLI